MTECSISTFYSTLILKIVNALVSENNITVERNDAIELWREGQKKVVFVDVEVKKDRIEAIKPAIIGLEREFLLSSLKMTRCNSKYSLEECFITGRINRKEGWKPESEESEDERLQRQFEELQNLYKGAKSWGNRE